MSFNLLSIDEEMININELIENNPYIYGILNLLIGGLVGHKLSIIRDKRKEFNDVAFPIRQELESQLEIIKEQENGFGGMSRGTPKAISKERFIGLGFKICNCEKNKFEKAINNYHACFVPQRYPDNNGNYYDVVRDSDYDSLANCIKSLLKFCKLK